MAQLLNNCNTIIGLQFHPYHPQIELSLAAHACNPSAGEAKAGRCPEHTEQPT